MDIKKYNQKTFEDIKHTDNSSVDYWFARELQEVLGILNGKIFLYCK